MASLMVPVAAVQARMQPALCKGQPRPAVARPAARLLRSSRRAARRVQQQAQTVRASAAAGSSLAEREAQPLGTAFPGVPAVYAVYDKDGTLQYVGLTRKLNLSVANHAESLPELVASVKYLEVPGGDRESLTEAWRQWVSEAVNETGQIPPGNAPGETKWQAKKRAAAKAEIRLTPGKGIQDLTCKVEDLIDAVVKTNRVVAFIKGTRTSPSCGFSYRVLNILNESGADYEVVDVLDEVYNPGVREAIKSYTQWPTIPQVFVNSEFVGGCDILEEMHLSGELRKLLSS